MVTGDQQKAQVSNFYSWWKSNDANHKLKRAIQALK
jgi:hypothetical protein